jgi:putative restriction endonuclease
MPDGSFDAELRLVVFDHVRRLRDLYGSRIPRAELMKGVDFRGGRVPIWNYQKGIYKPAVLGRDGAALSIQTSADSPYEDTHDPDAGHFIYKYQGTDPSNADNVALTNAMREQRPLLYLVAVDPGVYDAIFPIYVVGADPAALEFTLVADETRVISAGQAADPILTAARRGYVTRAVMQRLHQQHFRRLVLTAYRDQCAICRIRHRELLDAAHILEDRDPRGEPLITNGVGLCKIHHSAYDANILGIDPDTRVHIREDILIEKDGPMLKHGLQELHGSRLVLPRHDEHKPNRDFLAERFDRFQAA